MNINRKITKQIKIGNVLIGGGAPIVVQSMITSDTKNVEESLKQIHDLASLGCELVRLAVLDEEAANALKEICDKSSVPLIADIHFDYRLAIAAMENGCKGIRINPGNIGGFDKLNAVIDAAKANQVAIRIGVNSGSVDKKMLEQFGHGPTALVESALEHVKHFESRNFDNIKVSLKSSSVLDTIDAYRLMSHCCDYPLHLGVTEAGTLMRGTVKSSVGLGILLAEGIGDTLRISLTSSPSNEIPVAWELLRCLGLRNYGVEIISCPTCGRCEIDLFRLADIVEQKVRGIKKNLKLAVMGCVVNGPGEAKEADLGLAGGRDKGIIFKHGKVIKSVKGEDNLINAFLEELNTML